MTSSDLIEMLREYEEEAGGPVQVQVVVRQNNGHLNRFGLDQFDVTLDDQQSGQTVLFDLS